MAEVGPPGTEELPDASVAQCVDDVAAASPVFHQMEGSQQPKLVRNRRLTHAELLGKFANRRLACIEKVQNPESRGVAQDGEEFRQLVGHVAISLESLSE